MKQKREARDLFDEVRGTINDRAFWADVRYTLRLVFPVWHILRLSDGHSKYEMNGHIYFALHELDRFYLTGEFTVLKLKLTLYFQSSNCLSFTFWLLLSFNFSCLFPSHIFSPSDDEIRMEHRKDLMMEVMMSRWAFLQSPTHDAGFLLNPLHASLRPWQNESVMKGFNLVNSKWGTCTFLIY